tara:strand:- start:125 stop:331 length:207 start_codon:yes stop_codon:yes gene_type:complete
VPWKGGFDGIHPAVYRLNSQMGYERDNEQAQIEHCQGIYPSMPRGRREAWIWLTHQGPEAYNFFCPRG